MSPDDIAVLVGRVKSYSAQESTVLFASPEEKLLDYRRDISQLVADAVSPDGGFSDFIHLISVISERQDRFMEDVGKHVLSYESAWNVLVFEICTDAFSGQLRNWVCLGLAGTLSLVRRWWRDPALSEALESELSDLLKAHLSASQLAEKLSSLELSCMAPLQQGAGDAYDNNTDPFIQQVVSSIDSAREFFQQFHRGCQLLEKTRILQFTHSSIKEAVIQTIEQLVQSAALKWETEHLDTIQRSIVGTMAIFDAFIASPSHAVTEFAETQTCARFSDLRTSELFSIIIDYPDTRAAISDLHGCVKRLNNLRDVAVSLRTAIQKRLLHPGATTNDILTQYISAIRCLRLLDPTSTVLEIVASPIRGYLRSRDDTVMCIVQDMVAEESELFEDMANGGMIEDDEEEGVMYDEYVEDMAWEPLPVEAKAVYRTAQRRDADVLSLLVSIFDNKDMFVEEFEKHLAQQLLECADYEAQREIRQVEMMKLRFGDEALERCEVMLKDLADSKRTDQYVAEASERNGWEMPVHATIVSRQFWSSAPSEQFTMPAEMTTLRDQFSGVYESLRAARKLEWRDALGTVTLEIELEDRTLEVSAKPAQAAVLFAFGDKPGMTLAEVSQALECSEEFALPRIRFWQARGVIRETSNGVFEVIESEAKGKDGGCNSDKSTDNVVDEDELEGEIGSGARASAGADAEALRVHFNFVVGMLTNFGPLPLDRIHSMLGMFLPGEKIEPDELKTFLALMVREDKLEFSGGVYKLT